MNSDELEMKALEAIGRANQLSGQVADQRLKMAELYIQLSHVAMEKERTEAMRERTEALKEQVALNRIYKQYGAQDEPVTEPDKILPSWLR